MIGCSSQNDDLTKNNSKMKLTIDLTKNASDLSVQAIDSEFNIANIKATAINQSNSSDSITKDKNLTERKEVSFSFSNLAADTSYEFKIEVTDEAGYTVYRGSKTFTVSGNGDFEEIPVKLTTADGLVIDFRNVPQDENGEVVLIPVQKEENQTISTSLNRVDFNYQIPANTYQMSVNVAGETIKHATINLLPGRKTIVKNRIDLANEIKSLGVLEVTSGQTGPAIAVKPEGQYFINQENIKLQVSDDATTAKYTLDGSDPANGISFSSGDTITIGSNMNVGDKKQVRVYAAKDGASSTVQYDLIKKYDKVNPNNTAMRLGALYTPEYTSFRIWSPESDDVKVVVNGQEYECKKLNSFDENNQDQFSAYTDIYDAKVEGDLQGAEYQFKIDGKVVRDPYGLMIKPNTNTNIVMDVSSTSPTSGSWDTTPTLTKREDAIIYEMHVRDFTIADNSGISSSKKGKFLGMVETGATNGSVATGIDHLKDLGVTHVQIMPMYDFGSSMYNWGYDPVNYNIPEDQYSAKPNDYDYRVQELKTMINKLHANGIRVVMDVVYNHTQGKEMFKNISPKFYTADDYSGVGNSIDTTNPMVSKMIRDSLEYWVDEYNVDGFRFDLMGVFEAEEVRKWGEYLTTKYPDRNLLLHGEPWAGFTLPNFTSATKGQIENMASGHIAAFNDDFRNSVIGSNTGTLAGGYMFNKASEAVVDNIESAVQGSSYFTADPEQTINYVSAHDNYSLWDNIRLEFKDDTADYMDMSTNEAYARRINKFAMGIVMTSQGVPFMHGGDEILRTKLNASATNRHEAENSYDAPDEVNEIDWDWKTQYDDDGNGLNDVYEYYKELIQLRKNRPGLRFGTAAEIEDYVTVTNPIDDQVVVNEIDEDKDGTVDLIVIYNSGSDYDYTLPAGTWNQIFSAGGSMVETVMSSVTCSGTAITVLKKE
jgi:type I pullulanase